MSKSKILGLGVSILAIIFVYAVWRGYFDPSTFEVKQTEWSSSKQLAVVARSSDNHALNGDQYFVLIGNHPFSSHELSLALHSDDVIFAADSPCLKVAWEDSQNLIVTCEGEPIQADHIAVQLHQKENVKVRYRNIPDIPPR